MAIHCSDYIMVEANATTDLHKVRMDNLRQYVSPLLVSTVTPAILVMGVPVDLVILGNNFIAGMELRGATGNLTVNSITVISQIELHCNVTATDANTITLEGRYSVGCQWMPVGFALYPSATATIIEPDVDTPWTLVTSNALTGASWVEKDGNQTGWSCRASYGSIPANTNGFCEFVCQQYGGGNSYSMMGLDESPSDSSSYNTISYAAYQNATTTVKAYENGVDKGWDLNTGQSVGHIVRIQRVAGVVTYWNHGAKFYTSANNTNAELFVTCSIYKNARYEGCKIEHD